MANSRIVQSGFTRAWLIINGVGPREEPIYFGELKFEDPSRSFGDVTTIEVPDPSRFNGFIEAGSIAGATERATFGLTGRYPLDKSTLLQYANLGCRIDVQAHIGNCKDPREYDSNWDKIVVFPDGKITSYGIEGFGALESSERAATNESIELSAASLYEIGRLTFAELEPVSITDIIRDVSVYGTLGCDDCDELFSGCDTVFAVQDADGTTNRPMIIFSNDGFGTVGTDYNTEWAVTDLVSDATFVGTNYVMISETANSNDGGISWISIQDALTATAGWQSPAVNPFTTPNTPVKMYSATPRDTLIVGRNGYVWKMTALGTITEVETGGTTSEDLVSINMYNRDKVLVGGTNNTLLTSVDGGGVFSASPTMPSTEAASTVTAVWMHSDNWWTIGYSSGNMWVTKNAGITWVQKVLPITTTVINDIAYANDTVGVVAVTTGSGGAMLRTTNGGNSYSAMPDGLGTLPTSTSMLSVAMCMNEPNVVYGGGEGAIATDGILVKGINA